MRGFSWPTIPSRSVARDARIADTTRYGHIGSGRALPLTCLRQLASAATRRKTGKVFK